MAVSARGQRSVRVVAGTLIRSRRLWGVSVDGGRAFELLLAGAVDIVLTHSGGTVGTALVCDATLGEGSVEVFIGSAHTAVVLWCSRPEDVAHEAEWLRGMLREEGLRLAKRPIIWSLVGRSTLQACVPVAPRGGPRGRRVECQTG
jgi:hypothetical protein